MEALKDINMNTSTCMKFTVLLLFIFSLVMPTGLTHGAFEAQTFARAGSIRLDGRLEFLSPDGTLMATIDIEIADTAEARHKGLMGRSALRMTDGMLFIFENSEVRYFWMYNTPLSLDMIFVDPDKRIIHIAESTQPMSTQTYGSRFPARYVVEVPAGFVKFFKIKTGMHIRWQRR